MNNIRPNIHRYLLLLFMTLLPFLGIKAEDADKITVDNPIYLGFLLLDEPTTETMNDICHYYGLTPESTTDGYNAYRASDGTLIRFKQSDDPTVGVNGNLIEIQTKASQKTLNKILSTLQYTKVNNLSLPSNTTAYDHGSAYTNSLTRCLITTSSPRTLTFRSINNITF